MSAGRKAQPDAGVRTKYDATAYREHCLKHASGMLGDGIAYFRLQITGFAFDVAVAVAGCIFHFSGYRMQLAQAASPL